MPTKKKSVTFSVPDQFVDRLENRADDFADLNRSSLLLADLESYWSVLDHGLARARQILTRSEAQMILDIQNGTWIGFGGEVVMWMRSGLIHNVTDGIDLEGYDTKWNVDGPTVLRKLDELGDIPRLALTDWCRRMWSRYQDAELWKSELAKFQPDQS